MVRPTPHNYFRGRIKQYDAKRGRGLIWPDEGQDIIGQLLLRRRSLRDPNRELEIDDRVLFSIEATDRGILATDVHSERVDEEDPLQVAETALGTIIEYTSRTGEGIIQLTDGQNAFFRFEYLAEPDLGIPPVGSKVTCRVVSTETGLQAQDIAPDSINDFVAENLQPSLSEAAPQNWLAQAIIARDRKRYEEAVKLYEKGLQESPSISLILSYASMQRTRNRHDEAMRIYENGIRMFADDSKLREDAGVLAAAMRQYPRALEFLHDSLALSRGKRQPARQKTILLALARTYYRMDEFSALRKAIEYYDEARNIAGKRPTHLDSSDELAMNIAKIRTQHHRGNLSVQFLKAAKFKIVQAKLLEPKNDGAEFVVQINNQEFQES